MLLRKPFIYKMTRYRQGVVYGQWRIHEDNFLKIKQAVPHVDEQKKIADFLSFIDRKIENIASQVDETQAFKKVCSSRCLYRAVRWHPRNQNRFSKIISSNS